MAQNVHCPKQMILGKWRSEPDDKAADLIKIVEDMKAQHEQEMSELRANVSTLESQFNSTTTSLQAELTKLQRELRVLRADRQRQLGSAKANTPKGRLSKPQPKDKGASKPTVLPLHPITPANGSPHPTARTATRSPALHRPTPSDRSTPAAQAKIRRPSTTPAAPTSKASAPPSVKPLATSTRPNTHGNRPSSKPTSRDASREPSHDPSSEALIPKPRMPTYASVTPTSTSTPVPVSVSVSNGHAKPALKPATPSAKRTPEPIVSTGLALPKRERRVSDDSTDPGHDPAWDLATFAAQGRGKLHDFVTSVLANESSMTEPEFRSSGLESYEVAWVCEAVGKHSYIETLA